MAIQSIRLRKNWFTNTRTREVNWDEIANNLSDWSLRTDNNLKQLGLDIFGVSYDYNNVGRSSQSINLSSRVTTLENQGDIIGSRNIGLDLASQQKIKIIGSNGSNLSSTNKGLATFNSTTNAGQLVTREITANIEVTLTGAHWGFDGDGDLVDFRLWILLIDTGSSVALGVTAQGGKQVVTTTESDTAVGNINSFDKVLVSSALSATNNCTYIGWVNANFDDTGNAGGENFWTVQNSTGDINIGYQPTFFMGEVRA